MQCLIRVSLAGVSQWDASLRHAVTFRVPVALCRPGAGMCYPRCGCNSKLREILYGFICLYNEKAHMSEILQSETQRKYSYFPQFPQYSYLWMTWDQPVLNRAVCRRLNHVLFMAELPPERHYPLKGSALSIFVPRIGLIRTQSGIMAEHWVYLENTAATVVETE